MCVDNLVSLSISGMRETNPAIESLSFDGDLGDTSNGIRDARRAIIVKETNSEEIRAKVIVRASPV